MVLGVDVSYRNKNNREEGEWISLPMSEDKLEEIKQKYQGSEMIINEYKRRGLDVKMYPSDSISDWNDVILKGYEDMAIFAIAEYERNTLDSFIMAINERDRYTVYSGKTIEDVARQMILDLYGKHPLVNYVDYKKYAIDLHCDGFYETAFGVVIRD